MPTLDVQGIQLFVLFVVPGLISMNVYRILMPARALDWGQAFLQALFYGSLNFAVLFPLAVWLAKPESGERAILYWLGFAAMLLAFPVLWPVVLRLIFKWKWFSTKVQIPYPTAWDYYFDLRKPAFVLVHLKGGQLLGGYWGPSSYSGSFPNDGDIYLEAVYAVDGDGRFKEPIPETSGVLLRKEQYDYVELFKVPNGG